jgi:hypothetical protein
MYPVRKSDKYPQNRFHPHDHIFYTLSGFLKFLRFVGKGPGVSNHAVKLDPREQWQPIDSVTLGRICHGFQEEDGDAADFEVCKYIDELVNEVGTEITENCGGCKYESPSQRRHIEDYGCMAFDAWQFYWERKSDNKLWETPLYRLIVSAEIARKMTVNYVTFW